MSPEQTKQAQRQQDQHRATAEARYLSALQALALREAEFLALDRIGASAAAKLEALEARNASAVAVDQARRGAINAAWQAGTLFNAVHLEEAVRSMLAEIATKTKAKATSRASA